MKITINKTAFISFFILSLQDVHSQGFVNLDFEAANVSGYSPGSFNAIPTAQAFPGWSAFYYSNSTTNTALQVSYDVLPLSSAAISIGDTNLTQYGLEPIQGHFSAFLFGANGNIAAISQTGLVPTGTRSLQIDIGIVTGVTGGSFGVMLGGQVVNMVAIQNFPNYTLYGGDVSLFAGQATQLTIMTPPVSNPLNPNGWEFDSIVFSPAAVPEPGVVALGAFGTLLFGFRRWQIL